jgi:hypothetical protein
MLVDSAQTIGVSNAPAFTVSGQAKRLRAHFAGRDDFLIRIRLLTGTGQDADNIIGFSQGATNGRDAFDRPEPPRMPNQTYMFLAHPEWQYAVDEFASDVRRKFERVNVFQLGIAPSSQNAAKPSLVFEGVQDLKDVYVYAADMDSLWAVAANTPYEVAASTREVAYKTVFVTNDPRFLDRFPRQFTMGNPYPNPFHPRVTLRYTLPFRWEKNGWFNQDPYVVTISLYDARGRLVRTLVNRKQEPGLYTVVWDGKSNTGRIAGSGAYFMRLTAGKFKGVKRMVMVK